MTSSEKSYTDFSPKVDEVIQDKTFVIFGANGNWMIDKIMREIGWKPLLDKYSQNFKLKWVESRLSINYENFKEGEQLVNRIPNCYMLTNKLGLLVNLHRFHLRCISENIPDVPKLKLSEFLPETYRIDDQKDRDFFAQRFKPGEVWISKPIGLNQGRGIYLVRDAAQYKTPEPDKDSKSSRLIQRYITNPLLIDGRKFDIRVYMLIASTRPYLVLFRNGYVRLSLHKYDSTAEDITVHLTNQFIQRRSSLYETCKNETILSFEKFNEYINKYVVPHKKIEHDWVLKSLTEQMKNIALFSFLSVKDKLKTKVGFFDLYGIDFLIDEKMKVWLLEVNVNPCLSTNCDHLKKLIPQIIQETIINNSPTNLYFELSGTRTYTDVSIECFDKSWDKLPLMPCNHLKTFDVLYYDCISGFDYTKNPLTYAMKGAESPCMSLSDGNSQIQRKKNIISVVFEHAQEEEKVSKPPKKSMFEIGSHQTSYNSSEYSEVTFSEARSSPSFSKIMSTPLDNKDTYYKTELPKVNQKNFETATEQRLFEMESKTSKFLIKSETQSKVDRDLKTKSCYFPIQTKKTVKKDTSDLRKGTPKKCNSSINYKGAKNADVALSDTPSTIDILDGFKTPSVKKQKKPNNQQIYKLQQTSPMDYLQNQTQQPPLSDDKTGNGKHQYAQQSFSSSAQIPSNIKALLKNSQVDTNQCMSTMKILKTLRPPGTSSIKPDYIATNKLLLQTMSKMNAERKIKNLQDTYYNQSITQFNF